MFAATWGQTELFIGFFSSSAGACWLEDSTFHFAQFGHSLHPPRKVSQSYKLLSRTLITAYYLSPHPTTPLPSSIDDLVSAFGKRRYG